MTTLLDEDPFEERIKIKENNEGNSEQNKCIEEERSDIAYR